MEHTAITEQAYVPERRPSALREASFSRRLAEWLAAGRVSPNAISLGGMAAGCAAGGGLAWSASLDSPQIAFLAAAVLIGLRLLANLFDGMVAVMAGTASPVGELYNEVPDRVSDAAIFIGAGYAAGSRPELGYLAACLSLFVAYVRAEGRAAGAHQEYCGPMAKTPRMAVLAAACLYCGLAPLAWQPLATDTTTSSRGLGAVALALLVISIGAVLTAGRRLLRIADALQKRTS